MVLILPKFWGDRLRARFGGSTAGENGLSSIGSEHSEAVDEFESAESLKPPPPFLTAALMQFSRSDEELCLVLAKGNPGSKPSCLHTGLEESFLFLAGEGGEDTLHLLANLPRFCFQENKETRVLKLYCVGYHKFNVVRDGKLQIGAL